MRPGGWRLAALGIVAALAVLGSSPGTADTQVLYRAAASGAAVHGFYDHEGLFPVPLVNLSAAYTEASLEPGPATSSLGSFLWDPQAAELRTILCVLSEERFCQFPEYPFQASASYPSAGQEAHPPTIEIGNDKAPVQARAAHEDAQASAQGALATATVSGLDALPMTPKQTAAARSLALALAGPLGPTEEPDPWLLSLGKGTGISTTDVEGNGASATSESELKEVSLLGGLITFTAVRGSATAAVGGQPRATASSSIGEVTVGDLDAKVGRHGLHVDDDSVGKQQAAAIDQAINQALGSIGLEISRGREQTQETDRGASAEAYGFSLDFERQTVPDQAPEGTAGPDVLRVPFGLAVAEAEVAQIVDVGQPAPPPPPQPPDPAPPVGDASGGLPVGRAPGEPPPATTAPEAVAIAGRPTSNLGVPAVAVATAVFAGLLMATGLTWLKVNEVLTE